MSSLFNGEKQYFDLSHLHDGAKRARFTTIIKKYHHLIGVERLNTGKRENQHEIASIETNYHLDKNQLHFFENLAK